MPLAEARMTRGGGHKDEAATAVSGFCDRRSYVRLDGKRFLFGDDLEQLRRQVFERDGYRCTDERDGERCGRFVTWEGTFAGHMHHIIPRGKRGDDSMSNLVTLCPGCHSRLHVRPKLRWIRKTA